MRGYSSIFKGNFVSKRIFEGIDFGFITGFYIGVEFVFCGKRKGWTGHTTVLLFDFHKHYFIY